MKRQVYINTRGGLTQDPRTLRQLGKQSMQDREPGSGTCMQLSTHVYVCMYTSYSVSWFNFEGFHKISESVETSGCCLIPNCSIVIVLRLSYMR